MAYEPGIIAVARPPQSFGIFLATEHENGVAKGISEIADYISPIPFDGGSIFGDTYFLALGIDPAWSPTGDTIAYTSIRDGNKEIYLVSDVNLTHSSADEYHPVWTRDGKIIFYSNWEDASTFYLYYMEPDGSNVHYYD